jgi:hypothetical protein
LKSNVARFLVDSELLKLSTLDVDKQIKLREKPLNLEKVANNCNLSSPEVQLQLNLKKVEEEN